MGTTTVPSPPLPPMPQSPDELLQWAQRLSTELQRIFSLWYEDVGTLGSQYLNRMFTDADSKTDVEDWLPTDVSYEFMTNNIYIGDETYFIKKTTTSRDIHQFSLGNCSLIRCVIEQAADTTDAGQVAHDDTARTIKMYSNSAWRYMVRDDGGAGGTEDPGTAADFNTWKADPTYVNINVGGTNYKVLTK